MMDIFCKIANGDINSYTIYEDDIVKCFLDVNPMSNGHLLIVPKKHYLDLADIDIDVLTHIMTIAKQMKKRLEDRLHIDGLTLIQNSGEVEEVKHFHLHLKPFYKIKQDIKPIDEIYDILK